MDVRRAAPKRIVLAVPVALTNAVAALRLFADEIVCLETVPLFYAVGAHYRNFPQVVDAEAINILADRAPPSRPAELTSRSSGALFTRSRVIRFG